MLVAAGQNGTVGDRAVPEPDALSCFITLIAASESYATCKTAPVTV